MAECIVAIDQLTDDAVQGPMRLADAWCCLDCEVLFTGLERCPRCAGSAIWPVAAWVSPALLHLSVAPTPAGLLRAPTLPQRTPSRPPSDAEGGALCHDPMSGHVGQTGGGVAHHGHDDLAPARVSRGRVGGLKDPTIGMPPDLPPNTGEQDGADDGD